MSEAKAPDIIEMGRDMNSEIKRQRLETCIRLAQEWKSSGMTQAAFAKSKGMSLDTFKGRLKKVRRNALEKLAESSLLQTAFAAVPKEHIYTSGRIYEEITPADQPVLMIQTGGACLQATNQIEPHLLKTALEVMLTC